MTDNCRKTCGKCKCGGCCSYKVTMHTKYIHRLSQHFCFQGKNHNLGDCILLPGQCSELVCEEGLVAGDSKLLPGASAHNVSHPEDLTLYLVSMHEGSNCCILSADAEGKGSTLKNGTMVEEGNISTFTNHL